MTLLLHISFLFCFFFFFQAEDGIRDYKVTGVQTCALPISPPFAGARQVKIQGVVTEEPSRGKNASPQLGSCCRASRPLRWWRRHRREDPSSPGLRFRFCIARDTFVRARRSRAPPNYRRGFDSKA